MNNYNKLEKWNAKVYKSIYPLQTGRTSVLNRRIKIHKEGTDEKVRPVINTKACTTAGLSWWLAKQLRLLLPKKKSSYTTTKNWVEDIKEVELDDDEQLAIFDIESMFLTIDRKEALDELTIILNKLVDERGWITIDEKHWEPQELVDLVALCMDDNVFRWDGLWFRQASGVFMGNSLSPLLAEIIFGDIDLDGFYWGEAQGRKGFVPGNLVTKLLPNQSVTVEPARSRRGGDRWTGISYSKLQKRKMLALYDYDPQELSPNVDADAELSFHMGELIYVYGDLDEDGFYCGEINGVRGLVPSNFLTETTQDYRQSISSSNFTLYDTSGMGRAK
uniref:SH3 domain-containing protein n=1 Tax=Strigamia maritima TaxID=126957 RepID=T1IHF1_STRMM